MFVFRLDEVLYVCDHEIGFKDGEVVAFDDGDKQAITIARQFREFLCDEGVCGCFDPEGKLAVGPEEQTKFEKDWEQAMAQVQSGTLAPPEVSVGLYPHPPADFTYTPVVWAKMNHEQRLAWVRERLKKETPYLVDVQERNVRDTKG